MNFKTALSGSALAIITATSTLGITPAAQAADGCGRGMHLSGYQQSCVVSSRGGQHLVCPRGYRPARRGPVRCIRNNFAPRPNYVNAHNVTRVNYGSGVFKQKRGNRWIERNSNGTYRFQETHRDGSTVYLKDNNRHLKVELDLSRNQVILDDVFQRKVLYTIVQAY